MIGCMEVFIMFQYGNIENFHFEGSSNENTFDVKKHWSIFFETLFQDLLIVVMVFVK